MAEEFEARASDSKRAIRSVDRTETVLRCLSRFDDSVTLADLAEEVALSETGKPITALSGDYIKDVYLALYHAEIPFLVDQSVVAYDQETDRVAIQPGIDIEQYIDDIRSPNR